MSKKPRKQRSNKPPMSEFARTAEEYDAAGRIMAKGFADTFVEIANPTRRRGERMFDLLQAQFTKKTDIPATWKSLGKRGQQAWIALAKHVEDEIADRPVKDEPLPMRLICPDCGALHLDIGEFATRVHHTHACQECGMVWRPAVHATVGVAFLPGFKNP